MIIRSFLLFLSLLLAGCGYNVIYSPLNNPVTPEQRVIAGEVAARGPTAPADVRIFFTQRPTKPYIELGIITIPTQQAVPNQEEIFSLFRDKAAEVGGDGVIIMDTQTAVDSYSRPSFYSDWGVYYSEVIRSRSIFRGMVIQYTE
ncbi:MAG: hypothetical protein AAFX93_14335 [Verrucomicrobiota bacterium]